MNEKYDALSTFTDGQEYVDGSPVKVVNVKKLRGALYAFVDREMAFAEPTEEPDPEILTKRWYRYMRDKYDGWLLLLEKTDTSASDLVGIVEEMYDKHDEFRSMVDSKWSYNPPVEDEVGDGTGPSTPTDLRGWVEAEGVASNDGVAVKTKSERKRRARPGTIDKFVEDHGTTDRFETHDKMEKVPVNDVIHGDAKDVMMGLPGNIADVIITSPPYWALRDYEGDVESVFGGDPDCDHVWDVDSIQKLGGLNESAMGYRRNQRINAERATCSECGAWRGQLGHEPHPDLFVAHLVDIFEGAKRALKPGGSLFVNIDDTYGGIPGGYWEGGSPLGSEGHRPGLDVGGSMPEKCLSAVPERFVLGMMDAGWIRRNTIIWAKQVVFEDDDVRGATKPTQVHDRVNEKASEYLYHFVMNKQYKYELDRIRRPHKTLPGSGAHYSDDAKNLRDDAQGGLARDFDERDFYHEKGGNLPNVWQINPARSEDAHFAPFPERLVERPIKACSDPGGLVLDPFAGTGSTLRVAARLGRNYLGIDASEEYVEMARRNTIGVRMVDES